jgi:hypothetical protein
VLTLLAKQDSGLLPCIFQYRCGKDNQGEMGDISPFHLIAQRLTVIMVLSTVVPKFFSGIDSFDKTRFRFIAIHLPILLPERESGGTSGVTSRHFI